MKRFHVHLHVDDLPKSVGFYSKLVTTEPARLERYFAKWTTFMDTAFRLKPCIELMLSLPLNSLAGMSLQREIDQIGKAGA